MPAIAVGNHQGMSCDIGAQDGNKEDIEKPVLVILLVLAPAIDEWLVTHATARRAQTKNNKEHTKETPKRHKITRKGTRRCFY